MDQAEQEKRMHSNPEKGGKDAKGSLNVENLFQHEYITLMKRKPISQSCQLVKLQYYYFTMVLSFFLSSC